MSLDRRTDSLDISICQMSRKCHFYRNIHTQSSIFFYQFLAYIQTFFCVNIYIFVYNRYKWKNVVLFPMTQSMGEMWKMNLAFTNHHPTTGYLPPIQIETFCNYHYSIHGNSKVSKSICSKRHPFRLALSKGNQMAHKDKSDAFSRVCAVK